jgi:hypothetical protein
MLTGNEYKKLNIVFRKCTGTRAERGGTED